MTADVSGVKEPLVDVRTLLHVALVGGAAIAVRLAARPLGEMWSMALFGAVFLGGQNIAIVGRAGGFRRRPVAAALFFLAMVSLGALLGAWAARLV